MSAVDFVVAESLKVMAPPPKLTLSEWADQYRILVGEAAAEPGKWRTSRFEPMRAIMDAVSDSRTHEIVLMASAQVGKTEFILNTVGYFIHQDPSSMLMVYPTLDLAESISKERLVPTINAMSILASRQKSDKGKNSANTILHKSFEGMHLSLSGANSPTSLASRPLRVVLFDEIDKYTHTAGDAGDPIALATARTKTYWNRKIIKVSTPLMKLTSKIEPAYEAGDMREWYVPCGVCGEKQTLKWSQVTWEKTKNEAETTTRHHTSTAKYACEHCGVLWSDTERHKAVAKGEWIAAKPFEGIASFRLNEIYSPWTKLSDMANAWIKAQRTPELLKQFTNESLGETFEERNGEVMETNPLMDRREEYSIPKGVLLLTCGVDIQDDRIEGEVKGWGIGEESWGVKPFVIHGKPDQPQVWRDLDNIIFAHYKRDDDVSLGVSCTAIDSGGHFTDEVYAYVKTRESRRVFAVKGSSQSARPIVSRPTTSNKAKIKLFTVGTDTAKELIYTRLKSTPDQYGYMHFNTQYDASYFDQLTAEKMSTQYDSHGYAKRVWKKVKTRNEALDYTVYNLVALRILNPNFDAIKRNLTTKKEAPKPKETKNQRQGGGFVNGWKR